MVLAPGARRLPAFEDALHLPDDVGTLRRQVERGELRAVAFVVPTLQGWTLPAYEAALLFGRAYPDLEVTLVSPEPAPLAMFGHEASARVVAARRPLWIAFMVNLLVDGRGPH